VRDDHAALDHHRNEISVAQEIDDVPAHAQNNDLGVELAFHIQKLLVEALEIHASLRDTQARFESMKVFTRAAAVRPGF
jgi:hypothetical protein